MENIYDIFRQLDDTFKISTQEWKLGNLRPQESA